MQSNNKTIDPTSRPEKAFIDTHIVQRIFDPKELDDYFDNDVPEKDYSRLADYQDGEDLEIYRSGFSALKGQLGEELQARMNASFERILGDDS